MGHLQTYFDAYFFLVQIAKFLPYHGYRNRELDSRGAVVFASTTAIQDSNKSGLVCSNTTAYRPSQMNMGHNRLQKMLTS